MREDTIYAFMKEIYLGFPQCLQEYSKVLPQITNNQFLAIYIFILRYSTAEDIET
jgi:hypothetical protein